MIRYDRDYLPTRGWLEYRKIGVTSMIAAAGPFTVVTKEGEYELPVGWSGFIAVDADGDPYPIDAEVHAKSYEVAD